MRRLARWLEALVVGGLLLLSLTLAAGGLF